MTWNQPPNRPGPDGTRQFGPGHPSGQYPASQYPTGHYPQSQYGQPPPRPPNGSRRALVISAAIAGALVLVVSVAVALVATSGDSPPNLAASTSESTRNSTTPNSSPSRTHSTTAATPTATATAPTVATDPASIALAMVPTAEELASIAGPGFTQTYDSATPRVSSVASPAECVSAEYLFNGPGFDGATTYSRKWEGDSSFFNAVAVVYPTVEAALASEQTIVGELSACTQGTVLFDVVDWRVDTAFQATAPYTWGFTQMTNTDGSPVTQTWTCNYRIEFAGDRAGYSWTCGSDNGVGVVEKLVDTTLA